MGIFLKNKPSAINIIVSTAIVQFILMLMFGLLLIKPKLAHQTTGSQPFIIEFDQRADRDNISDVHQILTHSSAVDNSSINHITKEEAIALMASDIDNSMLERVKEDNPFRDIVEFVVAKDQNVDQLLDELNSEAMISGVYSSQVSTHRSGKLFRTIALVPALILGTLVCLLLYILLGALIESQILNNRGIISSLLTYGSDQGFVKSQVSITLTKQVFKGWLIGVVLFILVIYLFFNSLSQSFSDISSVRLLMVIILPLLLVLILKFLIVNLKFTKYIKTV